MLVLTRKDNEQIRIGDDIVITVIRTAGDRVRLGVIAPSECVILRGELQKTGSPLLDIQEDIDSRSSQSTKITYPVGA